MNGDMHVELVGSKLPMLAILGGLATLLASIVYATVWLTKLDERVLDNAVHAAENRVLLVQQAKIMTELQSNCAKHTFILNALVERVESMDK